MLSHKQIAEIIFTIEKEFEVNTLKYEGVILWPLIRNQITYNLLNPSVAEKRNTVGAGSQISSSENKYFLNHVLRQFFIFKSCIARLGLLRLRSNSLFFTKGNEGGQSNEISSLYAEAISSLYSSKSSLLGVSWTSKWLVRYLRARKKAHRIFFSRVKIEGIGKFEKYIAGKKDILFNYSELSIQVEEIFLSAKSLEDLFKYLNTPMVFYTVFFDTKSYSLSLACANLTTKSIEVQHGQQGRYSSLNHGFTRLPYNGYKLLPKIFWLWGRVSYRRKKEFHSHLYHKLLIGGHPLLQKFVLERDHSNKVFSKRRKIVIYAAQRVAEPFPQHFLDAINELSNSHVFWIRLHPNMLNQKHEILKKLARYGNVEIEMPTREDLYDLIIKADCVITLWSSVVYEALALGRPGLVLSKNGYELMEDSFLSNSLKYCPDKNSLIKELKKLPDRVCNDFILTDFTQINNHLALIFNEHRKNHST